MKETKIRTKKKLEIHVETLEKQLAELNFKQEITKNLDHGLQGILYHEQACIVEQEIIDLKEVLK